MLFGVFTIAWPLNHYLFQKPLMSLMVSGLICALGIVGNKLTPNYYCIWTACQYLGYFQIGCILRTIETNHYERIINNTWWLQLGLNIALFILYKNVAKYNGIIYGSINCIIMILMRIFGAVEIVTLLHYACNKIKNSFDVADRVSKFTMPMYLLHQQIIYFMVYWLNGKLNLHAGINFFVAIL